MYLCQVSLVWWWVVKTRRRLFKDITAAGVWSFLSNACKIPEFKRTEEKAKKTWKTEQRGRYLSFIGDVIKSKLNRLEHIWLFPPVFFKPTVNKRCQLLVSLWCVAVSFLHKSSEMKCLLFPLCWKITSLDGSHWHLLYSASTILFMLRLSSLRNLGKTSTLTPCSCNLPRLEQSRRSESCFWSNRGAVRNAWLCSVYCTNTHCTCYHSFCTSWKTNAKGSENNRTVHKRVCKCKKKAQAKRMAAHVWWMHFKICAIKHDATHVTI